MKRGVEFKLILPHMVAPPKDATERMLSPIFLQSMKAGKFENRFQEKIDVQICLSEKEVAAICFLNSEDKIDYLGFQATDELTSKWTKALYKHYWNIAKQHKTNHGDNQQQQSKKSP